jgi:hypothetical protein
MPRKPKPVPAKPAKPLPPPVLVEPEAETLSSIVRRCWQEIFTRHAGGESLEAIAKTLDKPISGVQIRGVIDNDTELSTRWRAVRAIRAHVFIETAAELTKKLAEAGLYNEAADKLIKLAEKTAPDVYGPKQTVELTGRDGAPIQTETVVMSPAEAYAALRNFKTGSVSA